jgi:hypothetical protein
MVKTEAESIELYVPSSNYVSKVRLEDDTVNIEASDVNFLVDNAIRYNGSLLYTGLIPINGQYLDVENGLIRSFS